jgi:hypothetical protein
MTLLLGEMGAQRAYISGDREGEREGICQGQDFTFCSGTTLYLDST